MKKQFLAYLILITVLILLNSCASLQKQFKEDPAKITLYTLKESWTDIRVHLMTENLKGNISDETLQKFKNIDDTFTFYYDMAVSLYLSKKEGTADYEDAINQLRSLILKARQKYYNDKNGGS